MSNQKKILGIWRKWYAAQIGVGEKTILIDGKHGKAAKELISHLLEAHPDRTPEECLTAVLNNWHLLSDIYRNNCKELHSIKKNWNSIINEIKNGRAKQLTPTEQRKIELLSGLT